MLRGVLVAKIWQSTPTSWIEAPEINNFGCDIEVRPIWVGEVFPEDVTDLLLNESDDVEMNERYEDDDLIKDKPHEEITL